MLVLLSQQTELLSKWVHDGEFADSLLKIGATFPLKKLAVGVVQEGYPLDVEEFVKQVAKESEPKTGPG
jgi:hypothetical protein